MLIYLSMIRQVSFIIILILNILQLSFAQPDKVKMLWFDAEADVFQLSSKAKVDAILDKCTTAGINTIALDVKQFYVLVLYNSKLAPKLTEWDSQPYPTDYDLLQTIIESGHKRGLKIHAALNVFSEGSKSKRIGPAFSHPDWEAVVYDTIPQLLFGQSTQLRDGFVGQAGPPALQNFSVGAPPLLSMQVGTVNDQLNSDQVALFTPEYGWYLYPKDAPENATDGNFSSNRSRWVSGTTSQSHWLELKWNEPQKIEFINLFLVNGYIISNYEFYTDEKRLVQITNNARLNPEQQFAPITTSHLKIVFPPQPGGDTIVRLQEIEVGYIDEKERNIIISTRAKITADSSMARRFGSKFYLVENGKITEVIDETKIGSPGIPIPSNGFLIGLPTGAANGAPTSGTVKFGYEPKLVRESEQPKGMLIYVNPANPEVQKRFLSILREIVSYYKVDGIILDRARYDNLKVDFSPLSQKQFEQYLGQKVNRFPEEIYTYANNTIVPGKYYKQWLEWRVSIIYDFIAQARNTVKEINPKIIFGDYVGSWYPSYYEVGVNWASRKYDPSQDYDWATKKYQQFGYAELLDYLCPGVYYSDITIDEALKNKRQDYASVEGGIKLVQKLTKTATPIYASLYYPNLSSPDRFKQAVKLSLNQTDGVMLFSCYHFEKNNLWQLLKEALN